MISSSSPIKRLIHAPTIGGEPVPFEFEPGTPEDEQDSRIKAYFGARIAQQQAPKMGRAAALGQFLAQAQNAIVPKAVDDGPTLIRSGPVWGMPQESTDNMFNTIIDNNRRAQEAEMARQENLARRRMLLTQMEEERDLRAQEAQMNISLEKLKQDMQMQEETRKAELQKTRDETLHKNKLELEAKKAELKRPKLVWAKDPVTGLTVLSEEKVGLEKGDPAGLTPQAKSMKAFEIAQDLMDNVLVNDAGEEIPVDFGMASQAAQSIVDTGKVNFDFPGYVMVKKPKDPNLVSVTDEAGSTRLQPEKPGLETRKPPKPSPREEQTRFKELLSLAEQDVKDAQADYEEAEEGSEAETKAKEALAEAKAAAKVLRDQYRAALKGEPGSSPSEDGGAQPQETDDLSGVPNGTVVINNETGKREIVYNGKAIPMSE